MALTQMLSLLPTSNESIKQCFNIIVCNKHPCNTLGTDHLISRGGGWDFSSRPVIFFSLFAQQVIFFKSKLQQVFYFLKK